MLGVHKTISLPQSTEYAKEMAKWQAYPSQWSSTAGRPYQYRDYPKVLYTFTHQSGKGIVRDEMTTVNDDTEEAIARGKGFVMASEAVDVMQRRQAEFGALAAERNFEVAHGRISERAASEVRAAEDAHGSTHMPVMPETPLPPKRTKIDTK